jgi:Tol biopolymer transport system component
VDFDPCWLSENEILFCKGSDGPPNIPEFTSVWLPDGSEQALTSDQKIYKYDPVLSPFGQELLCSGYVRGFSRRYFNRSLFRFDLGTQASERLTEDYYWDDATPTWSPEGSRAFFASDRNGHFEIWSLDLGTGVIRQVTRSRRGFGHFAGAVSPDGSKLACFRASPYEAWLEIWNSNVLLGD